MQGLSQHPAALSRLAHASGPANVAAAANESPSSVTTTSNVAAEPASIEAVEPAAGVASEPAAPMAAEPASIIACTKAAEPPLQRIGDPPLAKIEQTAAEAACLVAGSAVKEKAKQATGLTPVVNHMLESTIRKGGSRCTGTGLIAFVSGDFQ